MAKRSRGGRRALAAEHFRLARALASRGERERAAEEYLRAIEVDGEFAEAFANLGILYGQMGDAHRDEALRCLERAAELNPGSARARYNLGVALARRPQDAERARTEFERAIELDPGHVNSIYALAVHWSRRGDASRASEYHLRYQRALAGGPAGAQLAAVSVPQAPSGAPRRAEADVPAGGSRRLRLRFRRAGP